MVRFAALFVLAAVIAAARAATAEEPAPADGPGVDLELVLAADGSDSINEVEFRLQREGYAAAVTDPRVLAAIRSGYRRAIALAYIEWGGPASQHTIVDWMVIRDEASARTFAARLLAAPRMAIGYNSISGAIDYAAALMRTNAHEGERMVIDVSGDGPQIGGRPIEVSRREAITAGITINALVVAAPEGGRFRGPGGVPLVAHYALNVIGGFGAFVMTVTGRGQFADAVTRKMVHEIAGAGAPPSGLTRAPLAGNVGATPGRQARPCNETNGRSPCPGSTSWSPATRRSTRR